MTTRILCFLISLLLFNLQPLQSQDLSEGLVAHYPFDGNATDASGNGNDGIVNGATLTTDRFGNQDAAYSFDGVNDYINIGKDIPDFGGLNSFSISVWVNPTSSGKILLRFNKSVDGEWLISCTSNNYYRFHREVSPWWVDSSSPVDYVFWNHVVVSFDGLDQKIYVNGLLVGSDSRNASGSASNTNVLIGADYFQNTVSNFLSGKIDDIRIYDRALSDPEIGLLYDDSPTTNIDLNENLVAYYPFNGNANDVSGNNHNGVLYGPTLANTPDRFGNLNSSYYFDGSNDYISVESSLFNESKQTISFWANINFEFDDNAPHYFFDTFPGTGRYLIYKSNQNKLVAYGGGEICMIIDTEPEWWAVGEWSHFILEYDFDSNKFYLFVNGTKVFESSNITFSPTNPSKLYIGKRHQSAINNEVFNGYLDDFRIYDDILNSSEIFALYGDYSPIEPEPITIITGQVTDSETGLPIINAQVRAELFGANEAQTSTDANGNYTIESTNGYPLIVEFTHVNYELYGFAYELFDEPSPYNLDVMMNPLPGEPVYQIEPLFSLENSLTADYHFRFGSDLNEYHMYFVAKEVVPGGLNYIDGTATVVYSYTPNLNNQSPIEYTSTILIGEDGLIDIPIDGSLNGVLGNCPDRVEITKLNGETLPIPVSISVNNMGYDIDYAKIWRNTKELSGGLVHKIDIANENKIILNKNTNTIYPNPDDMTMTTRLDLSKQWELDFALNATTTSGVSMEVNGQDLFQGESGTLPPMASNFTAQVPNNQPIVGAEFDLSASAGFGMANEMAMKFPYNPSISNLSTPEQVRYTLDQTTAALGFISPIASLPPSLVHFYQGLLGEALFDDENPHYLYNEGLAWVNGEVEFEGEMGFGVNQFSGEEEELYNISVAKIDGEFRAEAVLYVRKYLQQNCKEKGLRFTGQKGLGYELNYLQQSQQGDIIENSGEIQAEINIFLDENDQYKKLDISQTIFVDAADHPGTTGDPENDDKIKKQTFYVINGTHAEFTNLFLGNSIFSDVLNTVGANVPASNPLTSVQLLIQQEKVIKTAYDLGMDVRYFVYLFDKKESEDNWTFEWDLLENNELLSLNNDIYSERKNLLEKGYITHQEGKIKRYPFEKIEPVTNFKTFNNDFGEVIFRYFSTYTSPILDLWNDLFDGVGETLSTEPVNLVGGNGEATIHPSIDVGGGSVVDIEMIHYNFGYEGLGKPAANLFNELKNLNQEASSIEYGIGGFYEFQPTGFVPGPNSVLEITYTDAEVVGINEADLAIYKWIPTQGQWFYHGGIVDATSNTITTVLDTFYTYTIAPSVPVGGSLDLLPMVVSIPADGSSIVSITSSTIYRNDGQLAGNESLFTVYNSAGSILNADEDSSRPGIQISPLAGVLTINLQSSLIGGSVLVSIQSIWGDSFGETSLDFEDNIAPAIPTDLIVNHSSYGVHLSWAPNMEIDLAGYVALLDLDNDGVFNDTLYLGIGNEFEFLGYDSDNFNIQLQAYDYASNYSVSSEITSLAAYIGEMGIVSVSPIGDADACAVISGKFNRAINSATVVDTNFVVYSAQNQSIINGNIFLDSDENMLKFFPDDSLQLNDSIYVTFTRFLEDIEGNPLPDNHLWGFRVATDTGCLKYIDECGLLYGTGTAIYYQDTDGDGLGSLLADTIACEQPAGYVSNSFDNNDNDCQQSIPLNPGWNLISLDVSPTDKSISNIFGGLQTGNLEFVTGFDNGAKVFNPNDPPFLNTLNQVADGFGYWVKVANADVLNVTGACLDDGFRKPFDAGWNLVAYPPDAVISPATYFAAEIAAGNLEFVTGFENGALVFNPADPPFLNTLQQLKNGLGYWVKVQNAVASGKNEAGINQSNVFNFYNGTSNLPEGETVLIKTKRGEIVGSIDVMKEGYLMTTVVYGDDSQTEAIEGLEPNEGLIFVWGEEVIDLGTTFRGDLGIDKIVLTFDKQFYESLNDFSNPVKVYPNPAQSCVYFSWINPDNQVYSIMIYDSRGQLILEQSGNTEIGMTNLKINQLPDGIYTYKLRLDDENYPGYFVKIE